MVPTPVEGARVPKSASLPPAHGILLALKDSGRLMPRAEPALELLEEQLAGGRKPQK